MRLCGGTVAALAALVSCTADKTPDTGGSTCAAVCSSELRLNFQGLADPEDFNVQLSGEGLTTLNVSCPDEIFAGGDYTLDCQPDQLIVGIDAVEFPRLVRVSVDGSAVIDVEPIFGQQTEVCETRCRDGSATVVVP
ncbi:MAG: hypothetical protein H6739_41245 [Alphaproteobacteria bacterium]|nr:hypothetical protein [Alphaproteobacteria bacterium]